MFVGYARVSTVDQSLEMQLEALEKAGCTKTFSDVMSGTKGDRPQLLEALSYLRPGDTLVVWRLDRLCRNLKDLLQIAETLEQQGIGFNSLTETIDTNTAGGKLIFHLFGALAEFERNLIRERTMAGLASARARGRKGGRPKINQKKIQLALHLGATTNKTIEEICELTGVTRASYYHYLRQQAKNLPPSKNPESL